MIKKTASFAVSLIILISVSVGTVYAASDEVYVGGVPFGVRIMSGNVTVEGFTNVETDNGASCPALDAGLKEGDEIIKADGSDVASVKDLTDAIESSDGKSIELTYLRNGVEKTTRMTPVKSKEDGKYKAGALITDGMSGIGTVTFIVPHSLAFAGLGHGICDRDTGEVKPVAGGAVFAVDIKSVDKGDEGKPGALVGDIGSSKTGTLISNRDEGVFGLLSDLPESLSEPDLIKTAEIGEVAEGDAEIRCTLDGKGVKSYKIKIKDIDANEETNKNFVIEVTDDELLSEAGGIVQGMSGSPIIQGGRLVGAVTHVFVSDPKTGYGISIENMMDALPEILR